MNKAIIVGRLGDDPAVRYSGDSKAVANFRIATNDKWTDKQGNKQERTEWHSIVVWGKQAEHCGQYLKKGSTVAVEGRLQRREYENKKGEKVSVTEVKADKVTFLDKKPTDQAMIPTGLEIPF